MILDGQPKNGKSEIWKAVTTFRVSTGTVSGPCLGSLGGVLLVVSSKTSFRNKQIPRQLGILARWRTRREWASPVLPIVPFLPAMEGIISPAATCPLHLFWVRLLTGQDGKEKRECEFVGVPIPNNSVLKV